VQKIKVLLADKRELFREGLAKILESEPNIEVVSTCSSGVECIQRTSELNPDVILLDTEISECDCIEAIQCINKQSSAPRIIMLTHSLEDQDLFSSLKAGARAYISKDTKVEDLIGTITRVSVGEVIITAPMASKLLQEFVLLEESKDEKRQKYDVSLSEREAEVLALVAKGRSNREIAGALFITVNTVKVHLSKILEKLHVRNRLQAAALALEKGIVPKVTETDA